MRFFSPSAYTLVELLIALTLSLFLLFAVAELFQRVGGTMNDTQSAMRVSGNLNEAAILLRQDLARIPSTLPDKPVRIANKEKVSDRDGFLEIIEGSDHSSSHPYVDEEGNRDVTVGDVDDIIGFTAAADAKIPFRGLIYDPNNQLKIAERTKAEIFWFVRGNTLYRRVRLIDGDLSNPDKNSMEDLARREKRFGHDGLEHNPFPHPLYDPPKANWYYLRMPTLEEYFYFTSSERKIDLWKDETNNWLATAPLYPHPDLWNQPYFYPDLLDRKSGSLKDCVDPRNRHHRAGEDVVLTNVLSFDIKVWCPLKENFVDLGTPDTTWDVSNNNQPGLPNTWDSWTQEYKKKEPDGTVMVEPPPYAEPLGAIQMTIRCFDPASRIIKQITVMHRFTAKP